MRVLQLSGTSNWDMLCYRIWIHLQEITSFSDTTIIITTHYIEEARQANMVNSNYMCIYNLGTSNTLM